MLCTDYRINKINAEITLLLTRASELGKAEDQIKTEIAVIRDLYDKKTTERMVLEKEIAIRDEAERIRNARNGGATPVPSSQTQKGTSNYGTLSGQGISNAASA